MLFDLAELRQVGSGVMAPGDPRHLRGLLCRDGHERQRIADAVDHDRGSDQIALNLHVREFTSFHLVVEAAERHRQARGVAVAEVDDERVNAHLDRPVDGCDFLGGQIHDRSAGQSSLLELDADVGEKARVVADLEVQLQPPRFLGVLAADHRVADVGRDDVAIVALRCRSAGRSRTDDVDGIERDRQAVGRDQSAVRIRDHARDRERMHRGDRVGGEVGLQCQGLLRAGGYGDRHEEVVLTLIPERLRDQNVTVPELEDHDVLQWGNPRMLDDDLLGDT